MTTLRRLTVLLAALAFLSTVLAWRRVRALKRGQYAILGGSTRTIRPAIED